MIAFTAPESSAKPQPPLYDYEFGMWVQANFDTLVKEAQDREYQRQVDLAIASSPAL